MRRMISRPLITALYVPGDRPERFAKAVATGAHLVIVDLEDAVAPDRKTFARDAVAAWLGSRRNGLTGDGDGDGALVEVRVNAGDRGDLDAVAALDPIVGVRVPKVESPGDLDHVVAAVGRERRLTALIESAAGIDAVTAIAAHPAVAAVALGEADLASELGTTADEVFDWLRARVLVAALAAGRPAPMMSVYPSIPDLDGLRRSTVRGRRLGFVGRAAVHPTQVPVIAAAFAPSAVDVEWARAVLTATNTGGVARLASGEMVDPAMRGRAERIHALAAATRPIT